MSELGLDTMNHLFETPRTINGVSGIREIWVEKNNQFDDPWVVMAAWRDDYLSGSYYVSTWPRKREACTALQELYVGAPLETAEEAYRAQ